MKKGIIKRLLVGILSTILVVSSVPLTALSAPADTQYSANYTDGFADYEKAANEAYRAYLKALKTGKTSDLVRAYELISKLTPAGRVHFFFQKYRKIYIEMMKRGDYSLFDPNKYLASNPDVYALARASGEDLLEFALNHYLDEGAFEGRSSCTAFDPVIAIVAFPDATISVVLNQNTPDESIARELNNAFTLSSGDKTTEDYILMSLAPVSDEGKTSTIPDTYYLGISKKEQASFDTTGSEVTVLHEEPGRNDYSETTPVSYPIPRAEIHNTPTADTSKDVPSLNIRKQVVMVYLCGAD